VDIARHNLAEFAEWLRDLPLGSLGPPGLLAALGILLLLAGGRLFRPALGIAAIFLGVTLAVGYARVSGATLSPLVAAGLGAIGGAVVAMLGYRLLLAAAGGTLGIALAAILASAAIEAGFVATAEGEAARAAPPVAADATDGTDAPRPSPAASLVERAIEDTLAPWIDRYGPDASHRLGLVRGEFDERWRRLAGPERTFFLASVASGAFVGLLLGLAHPGGTARAVTSLLGALFLLGGGVPLLVRFLSSDTVRAGPEATPLRWLAAWAAIAALGWLFQHRTRARPAPSAAPAE